jgi:hypothetical protein
LAKTVFTGKIPVSGEYWNNGILESWFLDPIEKIIFLPIIPFVFYLLGGYGLGTDSEKNEPGKGRNGKKGSREFEKGISIEYQWISLARSGIFGLKLFARKSRR